MSSYVFSLSDISIANNSSTVTVNNTDSFFGVIEGSQLFIAGKLPATVIAHDTAARTLKLSANWAQGDVNNASAQILPLGAVSTLLTALENNRAAYNALTEAIKNPAAELQPIVEDALRYLNTQVAQSPKLNREQSLTQRLSDYPTLKKTEVRPTESPNNKRLIQFDDVRTEVHIALTDRWFTIPTTIASRAFPVFFRGLILRFNNSSAYSGNVKMRVYPMGSGGNGLPNNPTLANHQWHEYETTVTDLYKIGEFNSEYFEGIIEYIELDTGWHQFDVNQSDVNSLNAKFDVAFGTLRSPFRTFYQKADGFWYSEDMTPDNPSSIGPSWTRDPSNPRKFTAEDASGSTDALRFFGDSFDEFQFEVIVDVEYITHVMAVTVGNSDPNRIYYPGPARFITNDRIYFKRGGTTTNAALTIESIKMRLPHYG
ncbi:hypothetical protein [Alteromonas sp. P256]|uniref:hypothetical protein n=1 Tax=Alteromonas sp. P256 TaxID=3117399 RepID=UPI002FE30D38